MRKFILISSSVIMGVVSAFSDSDTCKTSLRVYTELANVKVLRSGTIGKGSRIQNFIQYSYGLFSLYTWTSYCAAGKEKGNDEIDLVVKFQTPVKKTAIGNFYWNANLETFTFKNPGLNRVVIETGLFYEKFLQAKLDYLKIVNDLPSIDRQMLYLYISKPIKPSFATKLKLTFSPFFATTYLDNFYSIKGFSQIRFGASNVCGLSKNISSELLFGYQFGFNGKEDGEFITLKFGFLI